MAEVTMNTLPRDDWNTAFDIENIKANMVFPTEPAWMQFVKSIYKADGTMVVMLSKTTAMIVILYIMTNSKLEYLQGMMMMMIMMITMMMMVIMMMYANVCRSMPKHNMSVFPTNSLISTH